MGSWPASGLWRAFAQLHLLLLLLLVVAPIAIAQRTNVVDPGFGIPINPTRTLASTSSSSSVTGNTSTTAPGTNGTAPTSISSASSSPTPRVHTVLVGSGGWTMQPAELKNVSAGDTVTFEFYPPDHSVARAAFGSACVPYEYTGEGRGKEGFFSGVMLLEDARHPLHWNLTINSTEPIFYYCTAKGSCMDHLMVGAINPNETFTLAAQVEAARNAHFAIAPGEDIPSEGSSTLRNPSSTASAPGTPTATPPPPQGGGGDSHKLSGGAIAGIVVGGVAFLVLCAALFFYIGRTKSLKEVLERREGIASNNTASGVGHHSGAGGPAMSELGSQQRESHVSGWSSPGADPRQGHLSMSQFSEGEPYTYKHPERQQWAEMPSPELGHQGFAAELEAGKGARG